MPSILDYDFGSRLNKFVEKIPKFDLKGCFGTSKPSYVPQSVTEPTDVTATMQELSQMLTQAAIAVPTKQAYKVAKALSSTYSMDIGMKYLVANLSKFPEETLAHTDIEELRQSCLRQFPDSYAQEFFKKDIVRLAQNDMDVDFLTKVAATITSQSDFENKVKQLKFEGSDILNVDKRQFLLAHINESLSIEDTFPCDIVAEAKEDLGYIKESHKKYMADVYKAEIAENLQRVIEKNTKFEIPEEIDFRGYEGEPLYFDVATPEYQLLSGLGNEDVWSDYAMEMDEGGIAVNYEPSGDVFIVGSHAYFEKASDKVYEISEEIDYRNCTASLSLNVGSDRMEYYLLNNLWNDEVTKDTYCTEMKNAGVIVAYNEDDTYSIEKECDNTTEASNEHIATIEIPDEIDFSYYLGETLYFGADTVEYQLLSELEEDAWIEYLDEMASVGVAVKYDSVDDVFGVKSSLYGDVEEEEEEHEAALEDGSVSHAIESVTSKIKFFRNKLDIEKDTNERKELAVKLVELQDELGYLQNLEKQTTAKKAAKIYEVPKEIDYRDYTSAIPLRFGPNTAEYKLLNEMPKTELTNYKKEMSANGVAVTYDEKLDKFIIQNGVKTANKIEKIWVVEKPKAESIIEDILWESTIGGLENQFKGGLSKNDIAVTFTEEAEAKEFADTLLKEKTATKKVIGFKFGVDYSNFIKEEAIEALDLHWDASGYWVDSDGKAVTEDELYDIVERAYYYPSDVVSKTDKEGLSYFHLNKYFNEVAVPKKHKEMEELEDLGQQRLPNIANKRAAIDKSKFILTGDERILIVSESDIMGETQRIKIGSAFPKGYDPVWVYIEFHSDIPKETFKIVLDTISKTYGYDSIDSSATGGKIIWINFMSVVTSAKLDAIQTIVTNALKSKAANKKADLISTPVNMPEQEIYTRLTNETKDALSKIQSRASELKTLRDEHLQVHGELDAAKNKLAEEKQRISAELSGYLDISGDSFTKICTALSVAETLEAQTEIILNAVTTSIDKVIEANEKAIPEDAKNILDILKHMGNVADDIVVEAKEELTKMAEGVSYVRHALRRKQADAQEYFVEVYKWETPEVIENRMGPMSENKAGSVENGLIRKLNHDVYNTRIVLVTEDTTKQAAIDEGKFWPWIKTSIFGAKKFYGFADRSVNSFINDYGNLIKILLKF